MKQVRKIVLIGMVMGSAFLYGMEQKEANQSTQPEEIKKIEEPKVEVREPEAPKIETPKIETPKVEEPKVEMPKIEDLKYLNFFSWIDDDKKVAGLALPRTEKALEELEALNVGLIVTLTEKALPFKREGIRKLHIPIKDFSVPTVIQINQILDAITEINEQGKAAAIHCMGGLGRTGTMLACWLVAKRGFEPKDAIKYVREKRPHSIETEQQEKLISSFRENIEKTNLDTFSWIDDDKKVAGMACPASKKVLGELERLNIGLIVTLTEKALPFTQEGIKQVHIPVKDFSVPTVIQINQMIDAIVEINNQGKSAMIHCSDGLGRTGTMLACWLVAKCGFEPVKAIEQVREKRPSSIDTRQQEKLIKTFYKRS